MSKPLPVFEEWPLRIPRFAKDAEKARQLTAALKEAPTGEEAFKIWKKMSRLEESVLDEATHIQVLYSIDTRKEEYKKANDACNEGLPRFDAESVEFQRALLASPHRAYLEKKLGSFYFQKAEVSIQSFDSRIVEEVVEENKLMSEYGAIIASISISFQGETYNLTQMQKFLESPDRALRKAASEAYYSYMEGIADQLEDIFDKLVKVRTKMAKKMGYDSYTPLGYLRMQRYDYTPEMVKAYREKIHEVVTPIAEKIKRAQFARNKIRSPKVYDMALTFPEGNPLPKGSTEDKVKAAEKMYDELSPETSYYFRDMVDHHLLDLDAKPGKESGGYMTNFSKEKVPFIFSNFNGTSGDVDVLTHEFGHSFQFYMARSIKVPENRMPTSESCEIDSMSMEFFAEPWMNLFFDEPDRYRYTHLAEAIVFLPYGATVDEFQHWVYANPEATPEERDAEWHSLEEKYTPYKIRCYKGCAYMEKGRRWLTQAHIFENPFYYIDYTLAQVVAFEFFNLDRKNHELAWKRYVKLCKMGGRYPFLTLLKKDHMKSPFDEGTLQKSIRPLLKQLRSYKID